MIMYDDKAHVEVGSVTWNPSKVIPWNDPSETYGIHANPALANELKFNFIIGDRGNIYDIRVAIDVLNCGYGYWGFRVHFLKNFQLQLHHSRILRVLIPDFRFPGIVSQTKGQIEYIIRKYIIAETIQPEDFYE